MFDIHWNLRLFIKLIYLQWFIYGEIIIYKFTKTPTYFNVVNVLNNNVVSEFDDCKSNNEIKSENIDNKTEKYKMCQECNKIFQDMKKFKLHLLSHRYVISFTNFKCSEYIQKFWYNSINWVHHTIFKTWVSF